MKLKEAFHEEAWIFGSISGRRFIQQRHGTVQPGMNPGRFLLREGTDASMRRLDEYGEVLRLAAKQLACAAD